MGAKDSKRACINYEDAYKRITEAELHRIREAFNRLSNRGPTINREVFIRDVLSECVPPPIIKWLYSACGGNSRGITLNDLICGLVLLTCGHLDEKIKLLWNFYCADGASYVYKNEFYNALQLEQSTNDHRISFHDPDKSHLLFTENVDRVPFEQFRFWLEINNDATLLSRWLLVQPCVSISSELEMPTFYQTLAGVTHLEEKEICDLEQCFFALQAQSPIMQLDLATINPLISPPIPQSACQGLFLALDENGDGHIDFKELCCGVSAACRGPLAEQIKFCFKVFDVDRNGKLDQIELRHMADVLALITKENEQTPNILAENILTSINDRLIDGELTMEEFLIWGVEHDCPVRYFVELLFEICHISLGLRPKCRQKEYDIVTKWLDREQRRGFCVGQFWYLVSAPWWQSWLTYTSTRSENCMCHPVEEGIACDESFTSNSTGSESMGELLNKTDAASISSSSGVSSSSGTVLKRPTHPGPIDNKSLITEPRYNVSSLTGEGGWLIKDLTKHFHFELLPESLWKALALWYGGKCPLSRQVIKPPNKNEVELELYPLNLRILRHKNVAITNDVITPWNDFSPMTSSITTTSKRCLSCTAAFSRLATVYQVATFLAHWLKLSIDDVRLWHLPENDQLILLDDGNMTLEDLGIKDDDPILLEVRNKDLTWPEELGELCHNNNTQTNSSGHRLSIALPPGATGLHNLGNTCFMNAALQAVSNTRPLYRYFAKNMQLSEMNFDNPLGTKGQLAKRYGELCRELWAGQSRSVAPLKLRCCVSKFASQFAGGGQHDSQELLAWLLDGLHEDLNRVTHKMYAKLKDSDGRPDDVVAKEAWDLHLARNRSIVVDLFHGQLKSKVTCQTCGHESVTFDPFSMLSLPLPMESFTLCEINVIRPDSSVPIKYGIRTKSESTYGQLKLQLESLCGIKASRLLLAEVVDAQIKYLPSDMNNLRNLNQIELYAYELPLRCTSSRRESTFSWGGAADTTSITTQPNGHFPFRGNSLRSIHIRENSKSELTHDYTAPLTADDLTAASEVRWNTALCMPNIFCFKSLNRKQYLVTNNSTRSNSLQLNDLTMLNGFGDESTNITALKTKDGEHAYLVSVHRKMVRQDSYFMSHHKCKPIVFGVPLILGYSCKLTSCEALYQDVWTQVTRLLTSTPQTDKTNHATDCDDSLSYNFPFTLVLVSELYGARWCSLCPWNKFCRGCHIPCKPINLLEYFNLSQLPDDVCIAIDWDQTALHLRYQHSREKAFVPHESLELSRRKHIEPVDLDHCLRAFTSEERLEEKYHCSSCKSKQPATKKLQIWRLPPILIVHLKRFHYVNERWVKSQKVVNFPFENFNPSEYLASVPQQTIHSFHDFQNRERCNSNESLGDVHNCDRLQRRERLKSTSLDKTPVDGCDLRDFHEHHLSDGQNPFDLNYRLYSVVSHSGMLNGGHYVCYACNPNGSWYCYNDSSCREVTKLSDASQKGAPTKIPLVDTSSAYILFYERQGLDYDSYLPSLNDTLQRHKSNSDSSNSISGVAAISATGRRSMIDAHSTTSLYNEVDGENGDLRRNCVVS